MYFTKEIAQDSRLLHEAFKQLSHTNRLIFVSILSGLAALFQSAGGLLPGIGYLISPLATAPIILCSILSIRLGLFSYLIAIFMLLISQPSELVIFPFTTGLLGFGIGTAFLVCKRRLSMIAIGTAALSAGIITVLYGLKFPLLGPLASTSLHLPTVGYMMIFSAVYSTVWVELSKACFKRLAVIFSL